ncbi:MAG: hypothetical protein ACJ8EF_22410 [Bradyrhizobium sp.]|jgi:hypothetical protein
MRQHLPNRRRSIAFSFEFESPKYRATAGTPLQLNAETTAILANLCLQHGVDTKTIRHSVNSPIAVALDHFARVEVL